MIIGISGVAGSGKDTCADFLVKTGAFVKVSFADPLKRAARDIFDFSVEQLWGPSEYRNAPDFRYPREHTWSTSPDELAEVTCLCCGKSQCGGSGPWMRCYLTPRYVLQQLGTEFGRHCYPDVWIEHCLRTAEKLSVEGGYNYTSTHGLDHTWRPGDEVWRRSVVTPDLRFKNEVDAFSRHDARLIRVVRPGAGLGGSSGGHVSETQQREIPDEMFDCVIVNDGSLEDLEKKVLQCATM